MWLPFVVGLTSPACLQLWTEPPPRDPGLLAMASAVFVAPTGDDGGPGTDATPYRTLGRALKDRPGMVLLNPGHYDVGQLSITRPVDIIGIADSPNPVVLEGSVLVASDDVFLDRVTITGGFDASLSQNFLLRKVVIHPGDADDAAAFTHSSGYLIEVAVRCAPETCVQVTTSTITMRRLTLQDAEQTQRGLRVTTSRVEVEDLRVVGTRVAQVQAELTSLLHLHKAELAEPGGSAIVALRSSRIEATEVDTSTTPKWTVWAQTSTVVIGDSAVGPGRQDTVLAEGASVRLTNARVVGGPSTAIRLRPYRGQPSALSLVGGQIVHGDRTGVWGLDARVGVDGTRFVGQPGKGRGAAVDLAGESARARMTNAEIRGPAGRGIILRDEASGVLTGTISAAGAGGILVARVLDPVVIEDIIVRDCGNGPAVEVLDSVQVRIRSARLAGCPGGGVRAGERAEAHVDGSVIRDNQPYGLGAFGESSLSVSNSTVAGRPWTLFSLCSDTSSVVEVGPNVLDGASGRCL